MCAERQIKQPLKLEQAGLRPKFSRNSSWQEYIEKLPFSSGSQLRIRKKKDLKF